MICSVCADSDADSPAKESSNQPAKPIERRRRVIYSPETDRNIARSTLFFCAAISILREGARFSGAYLYFDVPSNSTSGTNSDAVEETWSTLFDSPVKVIPTAMLATSYCKRRST